MLFHSFIVDTLSLPYLEDFETTTATLWTPGGTASDWALGTPRKTTIVGAHSGVRAWITGGLTGNYVNKYVYPMIYHLIYVVRNPTCRLPSLTFLMWLIVFWYRFGYVMRWRSLARLMMEPIFS